MQRVGNIKFLSSYDTEKAFVTSAKGSGLYEKTLATEYLA